MIHSKVGLTALVEYNEKKIFEVKLKEMKSSLTTQIAEETDVDEVIETVKQQVRDARFPEIEVVRMLWDVIMDAVQWSGKNQQQNVNAALRQVYPFPSIPWLTVVEMDTFFFNKLPLVYQGSMFLLMVRCVEKYFRTFVLMLGEVHREKAGFLRGFVRTSVGILPFSFRKLVRCLNHFSMEMKSQNFLGSTESYLDQASNDAL